MLAPSWLQLGSSWTFLDPQPPLGQPKPFKNPSQALPDPFPHSKEATPHSAGPGQGGWVPGKVLFGAMLGCFGIQVGGLGGPSWRFGWLFGVYVGSCRAQMGVWEVQRLQGRGLEGLGLARGWLGTRIWVQHGSNLRQVGGNLEPPWIQPEPTWSQLGSM